MIPTTVTAEMEMEMATPLLFMVRAAAQVRAATEMEMELGPEGFLGRRLTPALEISRIVSQAVRTSRQIRTTAEVAGTSARRAKCVRVANAFLTHPLAAPAAPVEVLARDNR